MPCPYSPLGLRPHLSISPGPNWVEPWGREPGGSRDRGFTQAEQKHYHIIGLSKSGEGFTWGRAGEGQWVLAPEPFVGIQGW